MMLYNVHNYIWGDWVTTSARNTVVQFWVVTKAILNSKWWCEPIYFGHCAHIISSLH